MTERPSVGSYFPCPNCGYDLCGIIIASRERYVRCSECGMFDIDTQRYVRRTRPKQNGLSELTLWLVCAALIAAGLICIGWLFVLSGIWIIAHG